jgi:hypothetical protein
MVAIKATARKLVMLYYRIMTEGVDFVERGLITYQQKFWQSHHFVKRTTNKEAAKTS